MKSGFSTIVWKRTLRSCIEVVYDCVKSFLLRYTQKVYIAIGDALILHLIFDESSHNLSCTSIFSIFFVTSITLRNLVLLSQQLYSIFSRLNNRVRSRSWLEWRQRSFYCGSIWAIFTSTIHPPERSLSKLRRGCTGPFRHRHLRLRREKARKWRRALVELLLLRQLKWRRFKYRQLKCGLQ